MKLTRAQEKVLIGIGLSTVINNLLVKPKPKKKSKVAWTAERRRKFSDTMKKKWAGNKR